MAAETFTVAWRRIDDLPEGAELQWLLATARKVLANRRKKMREQPGGPIAVVPDHADDVAGVATLVEAFNRLPERDREVLALVAWDGLAPREGAAVIGCSAATFSVRSHRARRRLRGLLAEPATASLIREEPT